METTNFFFALSVLMVGINAVWIYNFYSMKRTYLKAGKCIVQLIDRIQKLETENKDLQEFNRDLIITFIESPEHKKGLKNYDKLNELTKTDKTSKKKANTKLGQKTKQSKIKGK